jgi:hypothetical protein
MQRVAKGLVESLRLGRGNGGSGGRGGEGKGKSKDKGKQRTATRTAVTMTTWTFKAPAGTVFTTKRHHGPACPCAAAVLPEGDEADWQEGLVNLLLFNIPMSCSSSSIVSPSNQI